MVALVSYRQVFAVLATVLAFWFAGTSLGHAAGVDSLKKEIDQFANASSSAYWLQFACPELRKDKSAINRAYSRLDKSLYKAGIGEKDRNKIFKDAIERRKGPEGAEQYANSQGLTLHKNDAEKLCKRLNKEVQKKTLLGSFMKVK
ncbi:hypothetical protein SAMN05444000_11183 [Shimia gijangensis]|uniref:Uncharacterized protein n=1 Tax=Shimia gijangensis TaxID=1470563 RepID=A0A1M6L505_9RHOB|nr:DUF5333 family protein [Shimia gijangensis]SHJ66288.1 hypothetical protein SAMN05444000_11183 [Shimia gijangensis]